MGWPRIETAMVAGAFAAGALAGIGAYQVTNFVIGHRWGDMPELAGGLAWIGVASLCFKGMLEIDRPRRERQREAMKEWHRRINGSE